METVAILAGLVVILASAICHARATDKVARVFYERDRTLWQRSGRPVGYLWLPPEMRRGKALLAAFENRARLDDALRMAVEFTESAEVRSSITQYFRIRNVSYLGAVIGCLAIAGGVAFALLK